MAVREIKKGNEPFKTIQSEAECGSSLNATYWDMWISVLLYHDFNNKWDNLILEIDKNKSSYNTSHYESIMSHINNLRTALFSLDLSHIKILEDADNVFIEKQKIKARKKIIKMEFQGKDKSPWMLRMPKVIYYENALLGNWGNFPVNPEKYLKEFRMKFKKKTHYTKYQTDKLSDKLYKHIEKKSNKAAPEKLAFYRAFLTVILENIDNIDDSFGAIGMISETIYEKYLMIDWRTLPLKSDEYFKDIIQYTIWEDYGVTDGIYPKMFSVLSQVEIGIAEKILQKERINLAEQGLSYQAENALTMLGHLYAKNNLFDKFIPIADEMGAREWERVLILSKKAEDNNHYDIAMDVFNAAISQGGYHLDFIKKERNKLKKRGMVQKQ